MFQTAKLSFQDDNPGRPNGPVISPGMAFAYKIPTDFNRSTPGSDQQIGSFGSCSFSFAGTVVNYNPYDMELLCPVARVRDDASSATSQGDEGVETQIDKLMSIVNTEEPILVLALDDQPNSSCWFFITPEGQVTKSQAYNEGCGTATITMHR